MNTLYVSDLDGTLLNSNTKLSKYTIDTINRLRSEGMLFSYATARSFATASIVTDGIELDLPVIVYNGSSIVNSKSGELLYHIALKPKEVRQIQAALEHYSISPITYSYIDGVEKVTWMPQYENQSVKEYIASRAGDKRLNPVDTIDELYTGDVFYFTCLGGYEDLLHAYEFFRDDTRFTCMLQKELYKEEYWFELMPRAATKANAILKLKELLRCDKVISFGDAINDIPMFSISDECYAVENAVNELKDIATDVISGNDKDGVAKWLESNPL